MDGLMMDFQLTLPHLLRRAETYFGGGEIVTRLPDKSFHRTTYGDVDAPRASSSRSRCRSSASSAATASRRSAGTTHQHHEAYFGIPCGGFVLHTLNLRLHPNDLAYIANHAGDRAVIVDRALAAAARAVPRPHADRARLRRRGLVRGAARDADPDEWRDPSSTRTRRRRCVTRAARPACRRASSTRTARSVLHALGVGANNPLGLGIRHRRRDPPGRADVPRERVGLSVRRDDARREARVPRAAPRPREPARRHRAGARHMGGGRADDLDRHPRSCSTRSPARWDLSRDEGDARRRLGRAARDDRRVRGSGTGSRSCRAGG